MSDERHWPEPVQQDELKCLICWPEGTAGYANELALITILNRMCQESGYGRVPQLTAQIEDIWRNPGKVAEYQQQREHHLNELSEVRRRLVEGDYSDEE